MADRKISELTNITGANLADADEFVVVDTSASETKAITWAELKEGLDTGTGFVRITGDTMTGNLSFGDNDKAIFGAGSDLQIFHDGANSYIKDSGTGNLRINAGELTLTNAADNQNRIVTTSDGTVYLYNGGSIKLATTNTGVDITGTVTADGLTVDGNAVVQSAEPRFILGETDVTGQNTRFRNTVGDLQIQTIDDAYAVATNRISLDHATGDISFYEDTGTTPKFFWDASAESLGIGTSSPSSYSGALVVADGSAGGTTHVTVTNNNINQFVKLGVSGDLAQIGYDDGDGIAFGQFANSTGTSFSTEHIRIDASGNVGIGVTPSAWYFLDTALQIKNSFINQNSAGSLVLGNNYYTNASNQSIYLASSAASRYFQSNGSHNWSIAPSGTAGNAITFTQAMTLDASGNLLVGTSTSSAKVTIDEAGSGGHLAMVRSGDTIKMFPSGGQCLVSGGWSPETDNTIDLGRGDKRWDDIYATNAIIQTSDRNEKQDIAEMDEAERRVAIAAKGLLRKFRWKDAVAEKGDDARIHFGIIAQDLQAAFEAEGLDAGRYAMFIHTTWTDEETGEERSRMGVRYSELLAFIIAAI